MSSSESILQAIGDLPEAEKRQIFQHLRSEFPIHPLEAEWKISAETIIEAIARAGAFSQRMFRGLLAEAACKVEIIDRLDGWRDVTPEGDLLHDFEISNGTVNIRIQTKLQRKAGGKPMRANRAAGLYNSKQFVVETQKTRAGKDTAGRDTRPYRFGDFDVLAVSMEPATGDWSAFRFTVANWLLPRVEDRTQIHKYQPVSLEPDDDWSASLEECCEWFMSGAKKTIRNASG